MHFKKAGLATLAAAALLLAANPATAASSAYASMSVFYKLIDLDLDDNIATSISFAMPEGYGNGVGITTYTNYASNSDTYDFGTGNVSTAYAGSNIAAAASVTNDASWSSGLFTLTTTGSANNEDAVYNQFNSSAWADRQFTLSANTMVVFSASYRIGADTTPGSFDAASSNTWMETWGPNADGGSQSSYVSIDLAEKMYVAPSQSIANRARVSFSNLSDNSPLTGDLHAQIGTFGIASAVTPVPEPESWAMLLAGLGFVGALARRRKQPTV